MGMKQDRERYRLAGLTAEYHWWDRETFTANVKAVLEGLEADPGAVPCAQFGLNEKGVVTLWLFAKPTVEAKGDGDPPGGDLSFPCPPFCG